MNVPDIPDDTATGIRQAAALGVSTNAIARAFCVSEHAVRTVIGQHRQPAWQPENRQQKFQFDSSETTRRDP